MIFKEYNQTDIINIKNQIDRLRACGIGVADLPQNLRDSVWKIVYYELKQNGSRQLALVFQLVDMRHPPSKDDLMMINYLICSF